MIIADLAFMSHKLLSWLSLVMQAKSHPCRASILSLTAGEGLGGPTPEHLKPPPHTQSDLKTAEQ